MKMEMEMKMKIVKTLRSNLLIDDEACRCAPWPALV